MAFGLGSFSSKIIRAGLSRSVRMSKPPVAAVIAGCNRLSGLQGKSFKAVQIPTVNSVAPYRHLSDIVTTTLTDSEKSCIKKHVSSVFGNGNSLGHTKQCFCDFLEEAVLERTSMYAVQKILAPYELDLIISSGFSRLKEGPSFQSALEKDGETMATFKSKFPKLFVRAL